MATSHPPQQDRSRVTRQALLEATIESLSEVGWPGTTMAAVATRAGVSRGAAQHHFATRHDLVRAAAEQVTDELTLHLAGARTGAAVEDRTQAVMTMLGELWMSSVGRAATHLWLAASTDPSLRDLVVPLERRLNREVYRATITMLEADPAETRSREAVNLTLHFARGVGLGALLRADRTHARSDLAQWAAVLATILGHTT